MDSPDIARTAAHTGGRILLRIALVCGIFIVVTFFGFWEFNPGAPQWLRDLGNRCFEIGLVMGLVAPLLAIVGAVLAWRAQRRLTALDWVSFAVGLACFLLPLAFILTFGHHPEGPL